MYIEINRIQEYPFDGVFYHIGIDESKPLDEQVEEEIIDLETKCDIQESSKKDTSGAINASFNIYFPFDTTVGINIKRGYLFRGSMYGMEVNGTIIGLFPTQMGGCVAYITDRTT